MDIVPVTYDVVLIEWDGCVEARIPEPLFALVGSTHEDAIAKLQTVAAKEVLRMSEYDEDYIPKPRPVTTAQIELLTPRPSRRLRAVH